MSLSRHLTAATLALGASAGLAQASITQGEWFVLAIDGQPFRAEASFAIDADAKVTGRAPCNRYFGESKAALPALQLDALGVTRMACPEMAAESLYLGALAEMTTAALQGEHLVLSNAVGRRIELVRDPGNKALTCQTCAQ